MSVIRLACQVFARVLQLALIRVNVRTAGFASQVLQHASTLPCCVTVLAGQGLHHAVQHVSKGAEHIGEVLACQSYHTHATLLYHTRVQQ